jgi:hypothetical protein
MDLIRVMCEQDDNQQISNDIQSCDTVQLSLMLQNVEYQVGMLLQHMFFKR